MSRWKIALVFLAFLIAGAVPMRERSGVRMPATIQVAGRTLALNGMGVREATMFKVDVYVAGLYLERPSKDAARILSTDQTRRLDMVFVRDVSRKDIVEAFQKSFAHTSRNAPGLQDRFNRLLSWMTPMKRGDRMTFTYVPQKGVQVMVKNQVKGVIPGADFSRAFFAIWLGDKPPNTGLKEGLLGKR